MITAGAAIASVKAAAEAIGAAAAPWPIAAVLRAAAAAEQHAAGQRFAPAERHAATRGYPIPEERVPVQAALQRLAPAAAVDRTWRQRIATAAVAVMPAVVVAVDMLVAAVVDTPAAVAAADANNLNAAAQGGKWTKKRRSLTAPPLCFCGDTLQLFLGLIVL